jgi:hypothetical protein
MFDRKGDGEQPLCKEFAETIALMIKNHLHAAFLRQVTYFILVVTHRVWQNLRVYQLV